MGSEKLIIIVSACVALGVGIGCGVGIGYGVWGSASDTLNKLKADARPQQSQEILQELDANNIKGYLRKLAAQPHVAGTKGDDDLVQYVQEQWNDQGMDDVKVYPYDIMLSYHNDTNPNTVVLWTAAGVKIRTASNHEPVLTPDEENVPLPYAYLAYSQAGTARGEPVYVNYATYEDFEQLRDDLNINATGKICIARFGKVFRGSKLLHAEIFGCAALLLFSDPADYTAATAHYTDTVYPDGWYLSGDAMQRGSVWIDDGDPLTPGYPSLKSAYHIPESSVPLPAIPAQQISYDDAHVFMSSMNGPAAPPEWQGQLNVTYHLGPGYTNGNEIEISTHNYHKNVTTYTVVGFIEGSVEPDRYVLVGNHRDAWVFGAVDPSSGTAVMLELSRTYGKLLQQGWRPRRSVLFCSWGAEEFGLIGSQEWVEQHDKILGSRAVAYLNIDIAVQGSFTFRGKAQPMLYKVMRDTARAVPNPDPAEVEAGRTTVYDTWKFRTPDKDGESKIGLLGSGSDFAPFVGIPGVTCADLRYNYDPDSNLLSYPLYHTFHDTLYQVEHFIDPDYKYSLAVGQYTGELLRRLADSYVLPYDATDYATEITFYIAEMNRIYGIDFATHQMEGEMDFLEAAGIEFTSATKDFQDIVHNSINDDPVRVRDINDRLMNIERAFTDPQGLPGRPLIRHVIYAPSSMDSYAGAYFPGLADTIWLAQHAPPSEEAARWEDVRKHITVLTYFVHGAADTLRQSTKF